MILIACILVLTKNCSLLLIGSHVWMMYVADDIRWELGCSLSVS